jgi:hypothetical protein
VVDAGPDQTITLPAGVVLDATVSDDGLPVPPGAVSTVWSVAGGPGEVRFADPGAVDTTAAFSVAGSYVLRLTASDGVLSAFDEVTVTVRPPDLIFSDGFESGNLGAWTSSVTDGGNLGVTSTAALVGTRGLQALINDNNPIYLVDDGPNAESRYRVAFRFDPNSITMGKNDTHVIFQGRAANGAAVLRVEFGRAGGSGYQVRAVAISDGRPESSTSWTRITDAPHSLELDWRASSGPGANSGGLTFWTDASQRANLTGIDNDTRRIDQVRLGAVEGIDSGTRGTYFFDAFESHRYTGIAV